MVGYQKGICLGMIHAMEIFDPKHKKIDPLPATFGHQPYKRAT